MSVLVGRQAPGFSASAVIDGGNIVNDFTLEQFKGKYVILFFYPKDFTFVCPTELFAFQEKLAEFKSRNVELVAVSTDTEQSHWGWLQMEKNHGGIKGITYPIVADTNKTISMNYDVLAGELDWNDEGEMIATGELIAYRGLFLIDREGKVRHQLVNDLPLGRNVDEAIRMVDSLQHLEENGEVCPANWVKGKEGLTATHDGIADYLSKN
ncbi:peroxiredoxin [Vicingus serpentipes]|jgi:peroxiredoxin 2/4|uniref:Thioredoxin peroxidase n=1 Tax=Vicingus serpentipes TaxID=1926625 RepID=A0A5C6RTZ8_9FLAO|nr:peroxiredoxin [Vicingus serpentipes]TXB65956.1 peroxiredoxin [Vicingus serpentipes]